MTNTPFFHSSYLDQSLLFVLTALIILVISAGGGCDSIEDWQGVRAEPEEQGNGSGSGEVQDRQQGGARLSTMWFTNLQNWVWTWTAPKVQVWGVANGHFGWTCTWTRGSESWLGIFWASFAIFSPNQVLNLRCQVCTWTLAKSQGSDSGTKCLNLHWTGLWTV